MQRRARARANRRKRPPLRQRIPRPGELARWLGRALLRRRRSILSTSLAAALAAGGYAAGHYLGASGTFAIAGAELRGAAAAAPEDLGARLGDVGGLNIFRVNLSRVEARVEGHPWVRSARVRRALPDRLIVEVDERAPAAVAHIGAIYLVDDEGVPFVRVGPGDAITEDLVVITGLDRRDYARDPARAHEQLRGAIAAAEVYAEGDRPRLGEVHLGERGELTFTTYDDAVAIRTGVTTSGSVRDWLRGFDASWAALSERERATARLFRIQGEDAPARVTVDFSGLRAGN